MANITSQQNACLLPNHCCLKSLEMPMTSSSEDIGVTWERLPCLPGPAGDPALVTGSSLLRVDFLMRGNRGSYSESEFSHFFLQPGKQIDFNAKLITLHSYSEDRPFRRKEEFPFPFSPFSFPSPFLFPFSFDLSFHGVCLFPPGLSGTSLEAKGPLWL